MARRYYKHEELMDIEIGVHKPSGTLGSHTMEITKKTSSVFIKGRVSKNINQIPEEGILEIKPGETLGYDCGRIWKVPSPDSYNCPIRRWLSKQELPQNILEFSSNDIVVAVEFEQNYPENSVCQRSYGTYVPENGVMGEFIKTPNCQDGINEYTFSGGDCVVIMSIKRVSTVRDRPEKIDKIIVRPSANKYKVAEWLSSQK